MVKILYATLLMIAGPMMAQTATSHPTFVIPTGFVPCSEQPELCTSLNIVSPNTSASFTQDGSGRIDRLSDNEYAELQQLRQAVKDAETRIAKAHGVELDNPHPCPPYCATFYGNAIWEPDYFEFRGYFLLINVPSVQP